MCDVAQLTMIRTEPLRYRLHEKLQDFSLEMNPIRLFQNGYRVFRKVLQESFLNFVMFKIQKTCIANDWPVSTISTVSLQILASLCRPYTINDGDPWAPNNLLTPEQKKNTSWTPVGQATDKKLRPQPTKI